MSDMVLVGEFDTRAQIHIEADCEAVLPDGSSIKIPAGTRIMLPQVDPSKSEPG